MLDFVLTQHSGRERSAFIHVDALHQSAYCQVYFCEWKNKLVNVLQAVVCVHRRPNGLSDSFSAAASFLVQAFYLLK